MGTGSREQVAQQRIWDHRELVAAMDGFLEALFDGDSLVHIGELRSFLRDQLIPHVYADAGQIHPDNVRVAARLTARAMLRTDLDDISRYVARIEDAITALERVAEEEHKSLLQIRLRNLALRLEVVLQLHVETEERLYLPLLMDPHGGPDRRSFPLHCRISIAHTERRGRAGPGRQQTAARSCTYNGVWALSEESLLAGLGAGDPEAAAAFVRRFQGRVFGLALTILGDRQEAEDVAQETFVRAWRHAAAFDARRGAVATWLLTIARNVAVDAVRMRRVDPVDPGALLAREVPTQDDSDDRLVAVDESRRLRSAVATLPEEQRRALVLAAYMGYTGREISEVEDVPLGTVKTRIRAAMLKLRSALEVSDE